MIIAYNNNGRIALICCPLRVIYDKGNSAYRRSMMLLFQLFVHALIN